MLGALHKEISVLSALSDWVENSGQTAALLNAKVTLTGNQSLVLGHDGPKKVF